MQIYLNLIIILTIFYKYAIDILQAQKRVCKQKQMISQHSTFILSKMNFQAVNMSPSFATKLDFLIFKMALATFKAFCFQIFTRLIVI